MVERCASRIADALERHGWRGHFFVTSSRIDGPGFLQRGTIRDLRRRGHVIGSHSHTHPLRMSHCTEARLRDEWHRSIATLSDVVGEGVTCASVPGGYHSDLVARTAADAGVRFLFTSRPTSRAHRVGDMWVIGRYVLQRSTSAAVAAGDCGRRPDAAPVAGGGLERQRSLQAAGRRAVPVGPRADPRSIGTRPVGRRPATLTTLSKDAS